MNRFLSTASLCATILICASPALTATPQQLGEAGQLLAAQKPAQALGLLEAAHTPGQASTQEYFMLGIAAKQTGAFAKSERYFRAALAQEPGAGRIRLELAEVLFRQNKFDASRAELITVRSMNPPEQVRNNIDGFIATVDAAKANPNRVAQGPSKNWSAYITAGLSSDSNVNGGPDTDTVFLYGLPFTLSSSAQETDDTAFFFRAGINHQAQLDNGVLWLSRASIGITDYFDADPYDTTYLSASTGPAFQLSDRVGLSVPITFNMQSYNDQGSWYSQSWGIAPRLQYKARPNLTFYLDTSISRKRFHDNRDRDLTAYTFSPSLNYQPTENGTIALGFQYGREDSGLDIYSNDVRGVYVGYQHDFKEQRIQASITASYTDTQFDGIQAAYTEARHDISKRISATITYDIPGVDKLSLQGTASYQDNDSNLDINSYDRTQFSVSLTKRF